MTEACRQDCHVYHQGTEIILTPEERDQLSALDAELPSLVQEIAAAEQDDRKYSGGLIKSLIAVRLEILRTTKAIIGQRIQALLVGAPQQIVAHITTADSARAAELGEEMGRLAGELAAARSEAAQYSGGLVHSLKLSTIATLEQTLANLRQQHALAKFGLLLPEPQRLPSETGTKNAATPEIGGDATRSGEPVAAKPQIEITEVATRPTESNSTWTRFAWKVSIRNLTSRPLRLSLIIEFLDSEGFVVDHDIKPDLALGPSLATTFSGAKLITAAPAKNVATVTAKVTSR